MEAGSSKNAARFQRACCFVQFRASLAPLLRASLSRGPGPEGRKRSPFCLKMRPESSPQSLAAPSTPPPAWPSAGIYFLPSQPHFISQAALSVPPLSLCSASQLFPWASPPAPSCPPSGPRHWHRLPEPPVAWPFPSLFGALPKSAITSTHFSFLLT